MEPVTSSGPLFRSRLLIAMLAAGIALPAVSAQAQWRGRGGWHGGGWGGAGWGWRGGGGWGWRGPGWGWGGGGGWGWGGPGWGWGWGGVSVGLAVSPFYFGWPYYPPAAYYPPAYYAPPFPYGYYPNAYAPGYYGYASPPVSYAPPQGYAQQGYGAPGLDPNNCGTPDQPRACTHR